jgi:hypothetical protein
VSQKSVPLSQKGVLLLATVIMLTVAAGILAAATVGAPRAVTTVGGPAGDGGGTDQPRRPTPARV